jgi:hypothetical protein
MCTLIFVKLRIQWDKNGDVKGKGKVKSLDWDKGGASLQRVERIQFHIIIYNLMTENKREDKQ